MTERAPQTYYEWSGVGVDGAKKEGVRRGPSLGELHAWLAEQKITPYKAKARKRRKLSPADTLHLLEQLSMLLQAGLPILDALNILEQNAAARRWTGRAPPYDEIRDDIESGMPLSASLERHLPQRERMISRLVKLGETGGRLHEVLRRLIAGRKKDAQVRKTLTQAMTYPAIVVLTSVGVLVLMMTHIVPAFRTLYAQNDAPLPTHTEWMIALSNYTLDYGPLAALHFALVALACAGALKLSRRARLALSYCLANLPLVGALRRECLARRFVGMLDLTYRSGMPVNDAIACMKSLFSDAMCLEALRHIDGEIRQGVYLHSAVASSNFFPKLVAHMLRVGEACGKMSDVLQKLERHYDERIEGAIARATRLVEPCLILFVAALVGWIVVAMYAPVFQLGSAL